MKPLKLCRALSTRFVSSYFEKGYYAMDAKKFITTYRYQKNRTHYWFSEVIKPYRNALRVSI